MTGNLEDNYDFVCDKFNISLFLVRGRLSITVKWVQPGYNYSGNILDICSPNVTRISTNKIMLGDRKNFDFHEFSLKNTNYSYADVIAEFKKIIATIGK